MDALFLERFFAALRVGPERIAAVNDDVAGLEQRDELIDDRIHGRACFHHDLCAARAFECADEIFECLRENKVFSFSAPGFKRVNDARGAVENGDVKAARFHVQDEVFAHHGEANQADVTSAHSGVVLVFEF